MGGEPSHNMGARPQFTDSHHFVEKDILQACHDLGIGTPKEQGFIQDLSFGRGDMLCGPRVGLHGMYEPTDILRGEMGVDTPHPPPPSIRNPVLQDYPHTIPTYFLIHQAIDSIIYTVDTVMILGVVQKGTAEG